VEINQAVPRIHKQIPRIPESEQKESHHQYFHLKRQQIVAEEQIMPFVRPVSHD